MKLAEALLIRADLQNKQFELASRLNTNATVQEGEQPAEDPRELIKQLDNTLSELERIIAAINMTNAQVSRDGMTMTQMLAKRDCIKRRLSVMRDFLNNAASGGRRARGTEIKIFSTVPVVELQKDVDRQSAELRGLEVAIQELNWTSELCE